MTKWKKSKFSLSWLLQTIAFQKNMMCESIHICYPQVFHPSVIFIFFLHVITLIINNFCESKLYMKKRLIKRRLHWLKIEGDRTIVSVCTYFCDGNKVYSNIWTSIFFPFFLHNSLRSVLCIIIRLKLLLRIL